MLKIGITGGIGSGKSFVCKLFSLCGAPIYDADNAAKRIMNENVELRKEIITQFGNIFDKENKLLNKKLAEIVFNDPHKLHLLNSIVHPKVIEDYTNWEMHQHFSYVIRESAILFESKTNVGLDFIIMVEAPEELRIKRTMERDKRSRKQVMEIIERQMRDEEKRELADFIILNNDIQPLLPQVWVLNEKFLGKI